MSIQICSIAHEKHEILSKQAIRNVAKFGILIATYMLLALGLKLHQTQCSFDITNYGDTEMIYVRLFMYK